MCAIKRAFRRCTVFFAVPGIMLLAAVFGCKQEEAPKKPTGTIVARVGNAYLTLEELQASIPTEYSYVITREHNIQYVKQWINTELLYQEALHLKIDQEPAIRARLEKMRRDMLSSEVINRSSSHSGAEVDEQAVREYYESNRDQFVREANVVRYDDIVVDDLNLAWRIRNTVTHETFRSVAKANSKVPVDGLDESTPYVPLDAIPPKVRNAIVAAAVPSITGPYSAEDGIHILRVIGKGDKGTIATVDEARDEIVSRLSNMRQKGEMERLIADIRSRADVEFNQNLVPGVNMPEEAAAPAAPVTQE